MSARNTTGFASPAEARVDFGRELVAALITAQHRAREGKPERRFGEGKWWATEKRWGGGEGGPIGREVDGDPSWVIRTLGARRPTRRVRRAPRQVVLRHRLQAAEVTSKGAGEGPCRSRCADSP